MRIVFLDYEMSVFVMLAPTGSVTLVPWISFCALTTLFTLRSNWVTVKMDNADRPGTRKRQANRQVGEFSCCNIPISDNVGAVKHFSSTLTHALRTARHFALGAGLAFCSTHQGPL